MFLASGCTRQVARADLKLAVLSAALIGRFFLSVGSAMVELVTAGFAAVRLRA